MLSGRKITESQSTDLNAKSTISMTGFVNPERRFTNDERSDKYASQLEAMKARDHVSRHVQKTWTRRNI